MRRRALIAPVMLLLACSSGGGGDVSEATLRITPAVGEASWRANVVDLGAVAVDEATRAEVTLSPAGGALTLTTLTVDRPELTARPVGDELPTRLVPGTSVDLELTLTPDTPCPFEGTVTLEREDGGTETLTVRAKPRSTAVSTQLRLEVESPPGTAQYRVLSEDETMPFGAVDEGAGTTRTLVLVNGSTCPLEVETLVVEGDAAFELLVAPAPATLPPNGELAFQVRFKPPGTGAPERAAALFIQTNHGTRRVGFSGTRGSPQLQFFEGLSGDAVVGEALTLGEVEIGASVTRQIAVGNVGDAALVINGASAGGEPFSIAGGPGGGRLVLAPEARFALEVVFSPTVAGSFEDTLTVATSTSRAQLSLAGVGTAGRPRLFVDENGVFVPLAANARVDFGPAAAGETVTRRFQLRNEGDGDLTVVDVRAGLGFEPFPPSARTLGPDAREDFLVTFAPVSTTTEYDTELVIETSRGVGTTGVTGSLSPVCGAPPTAGTVLGDCEDDNTTLCLGAGRFAVTAAYQLPDCRAGIAEVATRGPRSGVFSLAQRGSWDVLVAVEDRCEGEGTYAVRAASATLARVELRVTDLETGATRTWFNPLGVPFTPIIAPEAFGSCPTP